MAEKKEAAAPKATTTAEVAELAAPDPTASLDAADSTYARVDDEEGNPTGGGGSEQTLGTPA